ncbi:hypothetical protein QGX11_gp075 [Pseudomonas phage PPSC2]|uniref:Uncharacterized protein n=1 Tax=Pseudomonas phage PPSC2 TaxID=2041350 RepID=A0A2R2YAP1_9CAUD|nr:hypothetical protein QGX11_gp075 [Pseudomonas phage PPSC2]ATN92838.1 hypothetical protein PPSC2_75 [Pseudomonas phage PPSC2]
MTAYEATQYIASLLEAIQVLHEKARAVAVEHDLTFDIELEGGANYNTTAEFSPGSSWQASSYGC